MLKKTPIILLSVICAIAVHVLLFTNGGHRLQSSILESDTTSHAEAHLVAHDRTLELRVNVTATNVTRLSGILTYDDESIILTHPRAERGEISIDEADFTKTITIKFDTPTTITKGETLATWKMTPVLPEIHAINLTHVTLSMTDGEEALTTEGTGEF